MIITILAFSIAGAGICSAIDGDTIRCRKEHIRLIGIDAPELPGHCRRGRTCVTGNGWKSRETIAAEMRGKQIEIRRFGKDRYGRTLAIVWAGSVNISCSQIAARQAIYKPQWDVGGLIGKQCK